MGFFFGYIVALVMLLGGNREGGDLLDALSTDVYWQLQKVTPELVQLQKDAGVDAPPGNFDAVVKNLGADDFATRDKAKQELERMGPGILPLLKPVAASNDPEVAAVAEDLIKRFSSRGQARQIRRLMAVRTLGERKEKDALAMLAGLADSKEMFVGDYARRAMAQIKGEKYEAADPSAALARDLSLLPAETALVAQSRGINAQTLTIATLIDKSVASMEGQPGMAGPGARLPDRKLLAMEASRQLLSVVERVGNIRMDGISVGLNVKKGGMGEISMIVHGKYNPALVMNAIKESAGPEAKVTPATQAGDVAMISEPNGEMSLLFPNEEQLILIVTTDAKNTALRDGMLAALKAGKGTLAENPELAMLMKGIDTKSPVWAAAKLNDVMATDIFTGFKTVTLDSKATREGISFTMLGVGIDDQQVKASMDKIDLQLATAVQEITKEAQGNPTIKPVADFMGSIKTVTNGNRATMTGEFKSEILYSMISAFGIMGAMIPDDAVQVAPPDVPMPVK